MRALWPWLRSSGAGERLMRQSTRIPKAVEALNAILELAQALTLVAA